MEIIIIIVPDSLSNKLKWVELEQNYAVKDDFVSQCAPLCDPAQRLLFVPMTMLFAKIVPKRQNTREIRSHFNDH